MKGESMKNLPPPFSREEMKIVRKIENIEEWMGLQEMWCSNCGNHIIDPNNPDSGAFFDVFGVEWKGGMKRSTGNSIQIVLAICCHCLPDVHFS
jgi:hypothetical protein